MLPTTVTAHGEQEANARLPICGWEGGHRARQAATEGAQRDRRAEAPHNRHRRRRGQNSQTQGLHQWSSISVRVAADHCRSVCFADVQKYQDKNAQTRVVYAVQAKACEPCHSLIRFWSVPRVSPGSSTHQVTMQKPWRGADGYRLVLMESFKVK